MYRINNIHGASIKIKKHQAGMSGKSCGCSGGEILLGSPVALAPTGPSGSGLASFPNLAKLDIPKIKSKMKKISF